MTEQGAAADNAVRDGAPGGAGALARSPRPGTPPPLKTLGPGILARGQLIAKLAWRRFAASAGASRRSIPLLGKRKKGKALASRLMERGR